jgi:hypothetical protein
LIANEIRRCIAAMRRLELALGIGLVAGANSPLETALNSS